MAAEFPHHYETSLKWTREPGARTAHLLSRGKTPLLAGPPAEFDGKNEQWSPEELLLEAVGLCVMTTFMALVTKAQLSLETYESKTTGILDKGKDGIRFTKIVTHVRVRSPEPEKAKDLLTKAKKYCIISNALHVPSELEITTE